MQTEDVNRYQQEARRIYAVLFARPCPDCLLARYEQAVIGMNGRLDEADIQRQQAVMDRVGDWEALEMAARWCGKLPILCDRFRVMVYLAETLPENYAAFISGRTRRIRAWLALVVAGLRSVWKMLKGLILLSVHKGALKNG